MEKLYQTAIKAHSTSPIGRGEQINATHFSQGYNASCGDEIDFSLQLNPSSGNIENIAFQNDSCAICTASASILCELSIASNKENINALYHQLCVILGSEENYDTSESFTPQSEAKQKSLKILSPVGAHPSRVNCALLPWETVLTAFNHPLS